MTTGSVGPSSSVFTGAGVSAAPPSALPLGQELRDDVLRVCGAHAIPVVGSHDSIDTEELRSLLSEGGLRELPWKLEYVIGRLEGSLGSRARDVLLVLDLWTPNRSHLLLALHLIGGGRQATLNFDPGIELAYDLLTGRRKPPDGDFASALVPWKAAAQRLGANRDMPLRVVATEREFKRWRRTRPSSPVLAKLHGTLRESSDGQLHTAGVVVTDEPQLAQLSPPRRDALEWLSSGESMLITAYSGEDIDVYEPLLHAIERVPTIWAARSLKESVTTRLRTLGVQIQSGEANDEAESEIQLARLVLAPLGLDLPPWPDQPLGSNYPESFRRWTSRVDPWDATEALAWMLADAGKYDLALALLELLFSQRHLGDASWGRIATRYADALADAGGRARKAEAASIFSEIVTHDRSRTGLRTYARVRWGEQQRNLRAPTSAIRSGMRAFGAALLLSPWDNAGPQGRARALSAIAHSILRGIDYRFDSRLPGRSRFLLRIAASLALCSVWWALKGASGNRQTFLEMQQVELAAFRALLGGKRLAGEAESLLAGLFTRYERSNDRRGQGNVTVAQALVAHVRGRKDVSEKLLDESYEYYTRPDGRDESGIQLIERRRRQLDN